MELKLDWIIMFLSFVFYRGESHLISLAMYL